MKNRIENNPFAGCMVVVTGKLENFTRDSINSRLISLGATAGSATTNILIDGSAKKMTVNSLFDYYMATKELADSTRDNYVKMWNSHVRDEIGNLKE